MPNGHGGKRSGAGRPKKLLVDKIFEGTLKKHKAKVLDIPDLADLPDPEPPEYLKNYNAQAAEYYVPSIDKVYKYIIAWLKRLGCLHLVSEELIGNYAVLKVRFMECESIVGKILFYKKQKMENGNPVPNTLEIVPNPMYHMSLSYYKMAESAWSKIWDIVTANSEVYFGDNPNKDIMAFLIKNKPEA